MNNHLKLNPDLEPRCLFCNTDDPKIIDVEDSDLIKKYTDSPYIS